MYDELHAVDEGLTVLSKLLIGEETLETTLRRIVEVARRALPNTAGVTISLRGPRPHGHLATAAATSDEVRELDRQEYELSEGPCLTAIETDEAQYLADPADRRWPRFGRVLVAAGYGAVLGIPLSVAGEVLGALNVYSRDTKAYTDEHREAAVVIGVQAGVALANTRNYEECAARVRQLQEALDSRVVIEQAKGVLMERHRCDPEAAFDVLREVSQRANKKLRLVAREVIESAVDR